MNAPFHPFIKPSIQLLREHADHLVYRCFCGREARTDRVSWAAGIYHCRCTGKRIPFPKRSLIGLRFRRLTVTAWAGKPFWDGVSYTCSGPQYWQVVCDCGQMLCLPVANVKSGNPKSCGCQTKAATEPLPPKAPKAANLSGRVFGKLTALHRVPRGARKNMSAFWLCQCACGKTKEVAADNLTLGRIKSCGCLRRGPKARGQRRPEAQVSAKP